jgi:CubicO group peptidase (beta-lactamase class C family)
VKKFAVIYPLKSHIQTQNQVDNIEGSYLFSRDDTISKSYFLPIIVAGIFCFVLAAGCTSPDSIPQAYSTSPDSFPSGDPKGMASALDKFDSYARSLFEKSDVPGMAVAIVRDDEVVYLKCFGTRNITTGEPVDPHTRFQLASISKSFTATTIAAMIGEGELSWDDHVATINPDFHLHDAWITDHVTFRDLLSHRTGLPEYTGDILQEVFLYNRSEILERLRFVKPTGEFRVQFAYMNADITAAAEAASVRAEKPWEDLVVSRILVPAGMSNTSPRFSDFSGSTNRAQSYVTDNGTVTAAPFTNDDPDSPAGGISSTITDMTRYLRLQLNGGSIDGEQIVAADALSETHRPQIMIASTNTSMKTYGLGWFVYAQDGRIRVEHGGDFTNGASTNIVLYPDENMGIVVLTNAFPGGHVLHYAMTKGWEDIYFAGSTNKDWYGEMDVHMKAAMQPGASVLNPFEQMDPAPKDPSPSSEPDAYAGAYTSDYYGTIRMVPDGPALLMFMGNNPEPENLVHYDGDTFLDPSTNTGVYFTIGAEGKAEAVLVKMFAMPGRNGTFIRMG